MKRSLAATAALVTALAAGCGGGDGAATAGAGAGPAAGAHAVVMHASPSCACCGGWVDHLVDEGFEVERRHHDDMAAVKDRLGVPGDQRSCHTSEVGGYVVEGHVPADAVRDLLAERPDIDGIALGGMPAGSPGMGGTAAGPLVVTAVEDGSVVGELGRY